MFSKHVLTNGIRVVLVPRKDTETITLEVGVRVGSRYEPVKINGVSHYAEHLMFKGTKKRPTTLDISKALDSVGAEYNAYTSKDQTGYYVKTDRSNLNLALDILSDMLINSKFDAEEMAREKKVIVEEINMYEDNPAMYVDDIFEQLLYKGNSLGWQISGSRESLTGIPREDFLQFVKEHYRGEKMVVCVAGNIPSDTLQRIEKYFAGIKGDAKKVLPEGSQDFGFSKFKVTQKKPQVVIKYKDTEQVQLALGVPTYSDFDAKNYALILLSIILGGNMSSRLFISVRERRGLAYHVRSSVNNYQDIGDLAIQAGLDKSRLNDAIKVILAELAKMRKSGVTAAELKRAKDFIRGKMTLELEDSAQLAVWFGRHELLKNKIVTPEEKMKKFMAVTAEDIKKVAVEILNPDMLNMALIGPFKDEAAFVKMLKF